MSDIDNSKGLNLMRFINLATTCFFAFIGTNAFAGDCPAKGEKFIKDNFLVRWVLTSSGEPLDPLLGCAFTNQDGERVFFRPESIMSLVKEGPQKPQKPPSFPAPKLGVYACNVPINIGGLIQGTPSTGHFFGLIDTKNYRDFDGKKGTYSLKGDVLTMVSGPLKGIKYKRTGANFYKPMDGNGAIGSISCSHNPAKSIKGKW